MDARWTFAREPVATSGCVTLLDGSTFCRSSPSGNVRPGSAEGLFFLDTRLLSRWELSIEAHAIEGLAATQSDPRSCRFVGRVLREGRPSLLVKRFRTVGRGMHEELTVTSFDPEPLSLTLTLDVDVDFADLFEVKEGRPLPDRERIVEPVADGVRITNTTGSVERSVEVTFGVAPTWSDGRATWQVTVPARGTWRCASEVSVSLNGIRVEPLEHRNGSSAPDPLIRWRHAMPSIASDHAPLVTAVRRGSEDLGSLRIFDPADPERPVVAAGAPWFMTLFGRDALLASYMALIVDPELALGVLHALARLQGTRVDTATEEEPGRILHEVRFAETMATSFGAGERYYGSVDATPLFVLLLGELRRWGLAADEVDALLPAADRALEWIERYGDRDGDGFVEYERSTPDGLRNQGWKDSWDGISFQDGTIAEPPIALAEVQAYTYAAYVARAHFAHEAGDPEREQHFRARASALKVAFNERFWLPDRGWFAVGLDRDKRPIDALASNMGHCLWTGIIDPDKAAIVADHLLSPELFSGWGVRTLATSAARYDPLAYHNGSVWPHENALIAAGLMRYGFVKHAHLIIVAMLDAAEHFDGRLPELFSGLSRHEVPVPVVYPASSSPQAWAAAAPLLFLRTLLRFDPWIPYGKLWVAPKLPDEIGTLSVARIPLAGSRISVEADRAGARVDGLADSIEIVTSPRDPLGSSAT